MTISIDLFGQFILWLLTIMTYSLLWKYNRAFRFVEHTYLALAIGHALNMGLNALRRNILTPISGGRFTLLIPLLLGLLMYTRLSREWGWVSRYPIALTIGVGTAIAITGAFYAQLLGQLESTMKISLTPDIDGLNSILILIFVICVMTFFTFGREHKGPLKISAKLGRYVIMIGLGATFGGSIALRLSIFLSVIKRLIEFPLRVLGIIL
jgi:hypothetical protein